MSLLQVPKSLGGFTQSLVLVDDRLHFSGSHEFADDGQVFFVHFAMNVRNRWLTKRDNTGAATI